MDKFTLQFTDVRLNADTAPHFALHLVLGIDSVSLMAAHPGGEIVALRNWLFTPADRRFDEVEWELRRLLRDEPLFHFSYAHIHCALFHPNATLVPRRLFQHNALPGYFHLLLQPDDYTYGYDELPEFEAYLVYATAPGFAKLCSEFFPRARTRHLAVPLLRYLRTLDGDAEHRVFVNFRHQFAQITVFERQNLLFYNTCSFSASSDLLYFVLLAFEQFRLNPHEVPLFLAGNLLVDSDVFRLLSRFVRDIRFAPPSVHYHLPADAEVLPGHCHLDLYALKNI